MGVVLLLMTICGTILATVLLAISYLTTREWLKYFVLGGLTTWFSFYIIIFLVSSIFSVERTLSRNEPKEYCGFYLDCHMHTAVANVTKTKTIGDKTAKGEFYVATIRVSSDARQASLNLVSPNFEVIDANGNLYQRDASLEKPDPAWDQKVSAGGSFEKDVVFDLPTDIKNPRLDIRDGYGIDRVIEAVLVGDEDSLFHKRTYFGLDSNNQVAQNDYK
jgi:hypothetical protein